MSIFGWSYPPGAAGDPNAPYNQDADFGLDCDALRDALVAFDTKRWDWEKIDCCLTGKDADLEPWGQQGIELLSCDDEKIHCAAHILKTWAGVDVCLNLEDDREWSDEDISDAVEAYLEQAQEVVCGCSMPGEWDGDSWVMSDWIEFTVPWVMNGDDPDYEATAQEVVDDAYEALRGHEESLLRADNILNVLSGWADFVDGSEQLVPCEAGKPGQGKAWGEWS